MNITIYINANRINQNDNAAIAEYTKRLSSYCKPVIQLKAIADAKFTDFYRSLKITEHTKVYQILAETTSLSSEAFAEIIQQHGIQGISHFLFFIGYTIPLEETDIASLSLSSMKMSNGLSGVVLCEQLYRSYRILNHQPYHK